MQRILSVQDMRLSDRKTIENGSSAIILMKNAGIAVLDVCGKVTNAAVVCGTGNNGGDGYSIAILLHEKGVSVTVFFISDPVSEDSMYYESICKKKGIPVIPFSEKTTFDSFNCIFDCIFGIGFHGVPDGLFKVAIEKINSSRARVISVDINSGLNGNSGLGECCVVSDLTVAIGYYKPGHFLCSAKDLIKEKTAVDIGIKDIGFPCYLLEKEDIYCVFKKRLNFSSKADYGYVCLIGGSLQYSGAAKLAVLANAAARSGAGVVQLAVPKCIVQSVMPYIIETTLFPLSDNGNSIVFNEKEISNIVSRFKTICIGMGIGLGNDVSRIVSYIICNFKGTLILDADALNAVSRLGSDILLKASCKIIMTPHIREFSRLTGLNEAEILKDSLQNAIQYAKHYNVTLLLKGPSTIITNGDIAYITDKGCPGMATAGSGDVLSGIITALSASSDKDCAYVSACASYIAGSAGQRAQEKYGAISMTSGDTVKEIAGVIKELSISEQLI